MLWVGTTTRGITMMDSGMAMRGLMCMPFL
ncbi:MAG: hypothetical protein PWP72_120 [Thermoanaerobacter sp.]|jgi:hypothetical protein|nr:hypothetical protein [Thermoanaerobacter sp.]